MSKRHASALASAPMYLDDRIPEGYVVICTGDGLEHSFVVRGLGLSVECPKCGRTALSPKLLDAYYERRGRMLGIGAVLIRRLPTSSAR